jgi:hypothetical protein
MAFGAETMKEFDETMLGLARIGKISRNGFPAPSARCWERATFGLL